MLKSHFSKIGLSGGVVVLSCLFSASCVTSDKDIMYLNDQMAAISSRLDKVEKEQRSQENLESKLSRETDSKLAPIRENQAEVGEDLQNIRREIQVLTGVVEEAKYLLKRTVERDTTEQDVLKASLTELTTRIEELENKIKEIQAPPPPKPIVVPEEAKEKEVPAKPKAPPALPVEPPVSPEKKLYDTSLSFYKEGKIEEAAAGFNNFIEKYPKSDLADNAQFWIGECFMSLKQFEQAILAFQKVIKNYPQGNKVPPALLRQAVAFYEIKDKTSSRLLLKKIIKKYPDSSEAKIAKAKLKTLQ